MNPRPSLAMAMCLLVPAAAYAQIPGSALALSGDDEYACTTSSIGPLAAVTISAWIKVPPGVTGGTIVGNHHHGVSWESVELRFGAFTLNSSNSSATRKQILVPGLDDDQWHHFAAVWDGAELRAYVDGELHGTPVPAASPPWPSPVHLYIGARPSVVTPPVSSDFEGLLDELRIWTVARSQAQIQATMHAVLGPEYYASPDSGLFAYWRFDQLEDLAFKMAGTDDVRDLSVADRHAEVVGGTLVPITVSVSDVPQPSAMAIAVIPNPSRAHAAIRFVLPNAASATVAVYDLGGRRVRTLANSWRLAGEHVLVFDGHDASGRSLSAGQYFVRLRAGGETRSAALVVQP